MKDERPAGNRDQWWVIGITICILTGLVSVAWQFDLAPYRPPAEPLRIGIWHGPPMEIWRADGTVGGLGPEVISEAARRLGIRLKWENPKHEKPSRNVH